MNTRKTILATLLAALAVSPLAVTPVSAQYSQYYTQVQAPAAHTYTQAELDQMLAPIALYPDALLSQILMAATYPIELVEAARWSRAHPRLHGDDAVRAAHNENWDPSVQSLVAFPQILQRMDENPEWTHTLGDAFLAQETQMMDRVQRLRWRAQAAGHLRTSEHIRVEHQGPVIIVRQSSPEYIYVPYYDPMEVYGTWMWPAYRPVAWSPWPGYSRGYRRPGASVGFWWGRPVGVSLGFFFGDFDWNRRHTHVSHSHSYYYRAPAYSTHSMTAERSRWQHDPQHRRAVAYRSSEVSQRFASVQSERRDAVREERRDERRFERRDVTPAQRTERREDRREDRQFTRQQAQPAAIVQAQPQAVMPVQRADRRDERRAERLAAPVPTPVQAAAQPRAEQRDDRRAERQAAEATRQAQQQAERQAQQAQRQAQQQAQEAQRQAQQQARQAQEAQRQAQQQARQPQPAATMPPAQAPQTPRAERQEQREERRAKRKEQREEKG